MHVSGLFFVLLAEGMLQRVLCMYARVLTQQTLTPHLLNGY